MNGSLTNQCDAPTNFITEISFLLMKIVIWRAFRIIKEPPITNVIINQKITWRVKSETFLRFFETDWMMFVSLEEETFERMELYCCWLRNVIMES